MMQFGLCRICLKFLVIEIRFGTVVIYIGINARGQMVVNVLKLYHGTSRPSYKCEMSYPPFY